MKKVHGLEIEQDLAFERGEWRAQRVAWVIWLALVLLALIGLTGGGLLASARARSDGGGIEVEYERFLRRDAESRLEVAVGPQPGVDTLRLWLDRGQMQHLRVERVIPGPIQQSIVGDRVVYAFLRSDVGAPARVQFAFRPQRAGVVHGRIGVGSTREALAYSQFVFP